MVEQSYKVNDRGIVAQHVDGELIAIDQEKGTYYSVGGCGPTIWDFLERGASLGEIVRFYTTTCGGDVDDLERVIVEFCDKLQNEGLILATEGSASRKAAISVQDHHIGQSSMFDPPTLEVYDDMKDYLLIDPVHKVDEEGWPNGNDREPSA